MLNTRRRLILALGSAALAGMPAASAQPPAARPARIGILGATTAEGYASRWEAMEATAGRLGLKLRAFDARGPREFEGAFAAMARERMEAVAVLEDAILNAGLEAIARLAARLRLPSVGNKELAAHGGLIGYGVNLPALFRRAAYFVDRILKGANPGGLPIEQATTFELAVNLGTAQAIGVAIPKTMVRRADLVIPA